MGWGSSVVMSCGAGHRHGLDLALLWLWHRPVAAAPIGPLAWEPPYAAGVALGKTKKRKETQISFCFVLFQFFSTSGPTQNELVDHFWLPR